MKFIRDDFLLAAPTARRLYHQFAATEPILDFHCHLSPRDIAANRQFKDLFEIWLDSLWANVWAISVRWHTRFA